MNAQSSALKLPNPGNYASVHAGAIAAIVLLGILTYATSLADPLLSDDFVLISNTSAATGSLVSSLVERGGDGNIRPLGVFVFGTYKFWANLDPVRWHLLGLVLNTLDAIAVYLLAFRLSGKYDLCILASSLFVVHAAHSETTAWVASTFDLLATFFSTVAILVIARDFQPSDACLRRLHTLSSCVLVSLLTAFAILSKESAYAVPVLALFILVGWTRYSVRNWTCLCASTITAFVLFAHRWILYGGPGGYVDATTGRSTILGTTLLSATKALVYRPWGILFFPVNLSAGFSPISVTLLATYLISTIYLICRFRPRCHIVIFTLACVSVALIPPIHLALVGYDLAGTRVFFLPSVFFCLFIATLITSLSSRRDRYVVAAVILTFQFAALQHNLVIRHKVSLLAQTVCEQVRTELARTPALAISNLPSVLDGVFFLGNGLAECAGARTEMFDANKLHSTLKWDQTSRRLKSVESAESLNMPIWLERR